MSHRVVHESPAAKKASQIASFGHVGIIGPQRAAWHCGQPDAASG